MELQTDTMREIQTDTQQWKTDTARNTDRHTKMENRQTQMERQTDILREKQTYKQMHIDEKTDR